MHVRGLVASAVFAACGQKPAPPPPAPVDAGMDAAPPLALVADAGPGKLPWPEAIRMGRWADAKEGLAAAPDAPEVRLARARVALATGAPQETLAALERLEDALPLLRDLVTKMRAEAWFAVGPFDKAAEAFGARRDAGSLVLAAEAWEKAGDAAKARAAWERVIGAEKRTAAQEERARSRRLAITRLKDGDAAAAVDARWLAVNALDEHTFSEAADVLEKLGKLLTPDELLVRARVLADAGRTDDAQRLVERAGTRGNLAALDLCRARADVLWRAKTRYPDAALAYRACAAMGGPHAAEDAFLSARAFLRANREADAVPAFEHVVERHPKTPYADQAAFQIAREKALAGRWKEAAFAFDEYVRQWPAGKERREAARYRGLAHLVSRNDKKARKLLEELAGGAEDPVTAARWTNLAALAALRDGDKLHALARWADVARTRPLTYPALVARARLRENGSAPPEPIEPAEANGPPPLPELELPPPIDVLHRIGFDAEAEEALREREAAIVAKAPTRGTEALCAAYALTGRAKRRFQLSQQIPAAAVATAPGPKNQNAWDCVYPRPYAGLVKSAAEAAHIAPDLVWAVMRQESAFDPEVVSPARAVGLMQLLPETARATAEKTSTPLDALTSPPANIALGALYLRELLTKLGESIPLAVASYNAGPEAIQRWLAHAKGESLDVFVEAIPYVETRGYVARVLGNLARYGYLDRGEPGVPDLALDLPKRDATEQRE